MTAAWLGLLALVLVLAGGSLGGLAVDGLGGPPGVGIALGVAAGYLVSRTVLRRGLSRT